MSDNSDGMKNATDSLGDHTDGVDDGVNDIIEGADAINIDATNDDIGSSNNIDRDANGTSTPQIDNISNDSPVQQETNNGIWIPFCQVDWDARCPDCGQFWHDTWTLRLILSIAELIIQIIQSHGMEDAGERCLSLLRLRVYCDYQGRALYAGNDLEMVDTETKLFTDLEQLSAALVDPSLDSLFGANPPPDSSDEDIYGTSGGDADDEAESESSDGSGESDSW